MTSPFSFLAVGWPEMHEAPVRARGTAIPDPPQAARFYARGAKPAPPVAFDPARLPRTAPLPKQTADQLRALSASQIEKKEKVRRPRREPPDGARGHGPEAPLRVSGH